MKKNILTFEIVKANNKALEQKLVDKCNDLPIISKHFSTSRDIAYTEPIVELNEKQTSNLKNLINEA